jgi:hypothetical protein
MFSVLEVHSCRLNVLYHQQVNQIMDPVAESTYKNIWMATAKVSETEIWYLDVLVCSEPTSQVPTWEPFEYDSSVNIVVYS